MKIKLIDDNFLDQPGLSRYISPKSYWLRDIIDPDIAIFTDSKCYSAEVDLYNCYKYAWIIEPPIINGDNYIKMTDKDFFSKFQKVFSYNRWLENKIPNFHFCPHGGTWLRNEDIALHDKSKICSMIFSNKNWNAGHAQRRRAYDLIKNNNVDFYGSGVDKKIDYKITALKDYMFSIAMENEGPEHLFAPNTDYFSEKLIDCFLSGTVPIYYGNPTICNYFDIDGILIFKDPTELPDIINNINSDLYNSKIANIKNNFDLAKKYIHPQDYIDNILCTTHL